MKRSLSVSLLLATLACSGGGGQPPVAPKTDFDSPSWLVPPKVPGVDADFNGTWERENSTTPSTVVIEGDALQQIGKDRTDPQSIVAFLHMPGRLTLYVNNFADRIGVFAYEFDGRQSPGGELRQYGIQAIVAADGKLYMAIVLRRTPRDAPVEQSEFVWICKRVHT